MKHSILRSFETLIRGMDPSPEAPKPPREERPKRREEPKAPSGPRIVVQEGVFLGRAWRRYADGGIEGETVRGMEAFRDLDQFRAFVEASPVLRAERARELDQPVTEPTPAGEAAAIEPITAPNLASTAMPGPDAIPSASVRTPQHTPANSDEPRISHANIQLARNLLLAGALGTLLCMAWWFRFHVFDDVHGELLRRAIGAHAIRPTNLSVPRRLACLFLNTDPCTAVKHWGRFAGYLAYEPGFLWASLCALGLGAWLLRLHSRGRA